MRSVSLTMFRFFTVLVFGFPLLTAHAQENSPFSRYGMGDWYQGQHIISRAMGGLGAAYADGTSNNNGQTINFANPAAYSNLYLISYDIGLTFDSRTLRSNVPDGKFVSNNLIPSYFALGIPINKARNIGMAFGLRPLSRINYNITESGRAAGDSISTLYQGSGGLNQVFIGVGKKWKGLSIGFNTGVNFGRKEVSTYVGFINDTITYNKSKSTTLTNFSSFFLTTGVQYEFTLKTKNYPSFKTVDKYLMRFGVTGNLGSSMNATQDIDHTTYAYNTLGVVSTIDTVYSKTKVKGTITMPASYAAGVTIRKTTQAPRGIFDIWSLGAEYTATKWSQYRFYDQADNLTDSWMFKVGASFSPDPVSGRSYWGSVNYRLGFFTGKDYVDADGNGLKMYGASFGTGIPIRKWNSYTNQFAIVNTSLQFGKRGDSKNNITEGFFRLSFGLSLSDIWFIKRKYD
jgi:hypothetical protein